PPRTSSPCPEATSRAGAGSGGNLLPHLSQLPDDVPGQAHDLVVQTPQFRGDWLILLGGSQLGFLGGGYGVWLQRQPELVADFRPTGRNAGPWARGGPRRGARACLLGPYSALNASSSLICR